MILDALDEVSDDRARDALFRLLNREQWQCRVLITTRPYGYDAKAMKLDRLTLFRLGELSPGQAARTDRQVVRIAGLAGAGRERIRGCSPAARRPRRWHKMPFCCRFCAALQKKARSLTT